MRNARYNDSERRHMDIRRYHKCRYITPMSVDALMLYQTHGFPSVKLQVYYNEDNFRPISSRDPRRIVFDDQEHAIPRLHERAIVHDREVAAQALTDPAAKRVHALQRAQNGRLCYRRSAADCRLDRGAVLSTKT